MNTREIAAEYRLEHWARIMRERQESGLSVKAFSERSGFHENAYYYWQRKLRESACGGLVRIHGQRAETVTSPSGFAEIRLAEVAARAASPEMAGSGQICAEISGIQVRADSAYPPERLAQLLRELARLC